MAYDRRSQAASCREDELEEVLEKLELTEDFIPGNADCEPLRLTEEFCDVDAPPAFGLLMTSFLAVFIRN